MSGFGSGQPGQTWLGSVLDLGSGYGWLEVWFGAHVVQFMISKRTVRFGFGSWFGAWLNLGSRRFCSRTRLVSVDISLFLWFLV
ncbi:hypothetical protein Hanom_Chr03g00220951 [Helianthus anomalus]